ncbi:MAG: TlpA family protein disulfide reductase [Blastocatellia bacterium]|nr:TlpA family protein disulfide reductase [Blastocatellia bacterium]
MSEENRSNEPLWTTGRIIATSAVIVLMATTGYMLFSNHPEVKTDSRVALPGTEGVETPPDFDVITMDGRTIKLSEYRGKVVVLDFWATWCPPCREEVPQLTRIARENRERGVEVVGLHIDDRGRSSPEDIRRFIDHYNINYTVGRATDDMFIAYLGEVETAIPQTLVFDRSGRVAYHLVGYTKSHARALDEAINRALAK